MIKKIYLFFLIVLVLVSSPFLIRYLLSNQKISILNRIYFNYPGIINRKKTCPSYDALLKKEMLLIQEQLKKMNKFFLSLSIYKFTKIDSLSGLISNSFLKIYLLFSSLKSNQLFG